MEVHELSPIAGDSECFPPSRAFETEKCSKPILNNVSGAFRSGRLTAIIGPSGSGKSSLLNVLSGFRKADGIIKLNGEPLEGSKLRNEVSYTEQEVSLWRNLTVEESLRYAAEFQQSRSWAKLSKKNIALDQIRSLGLEKCCSTLVRNLSGGEYKRLAMAIDLLANPKVMLLDEPTSGLDTIATTQVVSQMRSLAHGGRIVVCVIHQPSSSILKMFDDVYLVARGNCLYRGSLSDVIPRFARVGLECPLSHNPADFALEVASMEYDERVLNLIQDNQNMNIAEEIEPTPLHLVLQRSRSKLSPWKQFLLLTKRTVICTIRDPTQTKVKTAISIFVGLLVGTVYYDIGNNAARIISNTTFFQIVLHTIMFTTIGPAAVVFPLESAAFIREHRNNAYALFPYYLSKMIVEIPILILNTALMMALVYVMTSQPMELHRILYFWAICLLFGWISQMWGLMLGCFFKLQTTAFLAGVSTIPVMLFSGCFLTLEQIPEILRPLTYVSFERYAFEGLLHVLYGLDRKDMECPEIFCYYSKLSKYLKSLQMPVLELKQDLLALSIWSVAMTVAFYFCLRRRIKFQN
ncbi:ATP-binding cassette sub-family G member 1 isoform X2 [Topomyia yanbarensis]|uniref:ATP-binding cassette sub-family G member 1 isoform X2 n=1 Tax=Topomyia yanbarensis TaxID=2498891 RepID=UPI00273AB106|nr:ATP-binding cassette sub-family G member 1 isoform X2 [Topomyia yanbarensis]